jgi:hypothetical protein
VVAPIVTHALSSGLILSVALFGLILVVLRVNPRDHAQRLSAGCTRQVGTDDPSRQAPARGRDVTFPGAFTRFAIMFGTFNLLDWLALDWPLVYWQPRFLVLPGTEGMAGYRDYWFHARGFLIGCPIIAAGSALSAAIESSLM